MGGNLPSLAWVDRTTIDDINNDPNAHIIGFNNILLDLRTKEQYKKTYDEFIYKMLSLNIVGTPIFDYSSTYYIITAGQVTAPNNDIYTSLFVVNKAIEIDRPDLLLFDKNPYAKVTLLNYRSQLVYTPIKIIQWLFDGNITPPRTITINDKAYNIDELTEYFYKDTTTQKIEGIYKLLNSKLPSLVDFKEFLDGFIKKKAHYSTDDVPSKYNRNPEFPNLLHFYDSNNVLKQLEIDSSMKRFLQQLGYLRYNTTLIRFTIWLIQLMRILRLEINNNLLKFDNTDSYTSGLSLANIELTEEDMV